MRPRLRQRLYQSVALLVVVGAAAWGYHRIVRPDRTLLARVATAQLRSIFGPRAEFGAFHLNLPQSVTIDELRVRSAETNLPTLEAKRVTIRHDLLALASGIYRPVEIEIEGARIVTRETEDGAAFDFPLHLSTIDSGDRPPRIRVRDATILYRARPGSDRLQESHVLVLDQIRLDVTPDTAQRVLVEGACQTRGLGQDDVEIRVGGWADLDADTLRLRATWDPMRLTPALLAHLADEVAAHVESQRDQSGRLEVTLLRDPAEGEGRLRVQVGWTGQVHVDLQSIPGVELVDATGWEQIQSLISSPTLDVVVSQEGVDIRSLVAALAGGDARLRGQILDEGETIRLDMDLHGVRVQAPALREALGERGLRALDAFQPRGTVDAFMRVRKEKGQDLSWTIDAILEDASFRFLGWPDDEGITYGFPYPVDHASGRIHVQPGLIFFDDIVGIGGGSRTTSVSILGWRRSSWTGGPTGRIRFTDAGIDLRLTIVAEEVAVDRVLDEAVAGAEFAEDAQDFELSGVVDRIEVDVFLVPGRDERARSEVRLTLEGETFRYAPFPLLLEEVKGWVTLRKPWVTQTRRGKVFRFDANGRVQGAPVHVWAEHDADENRGLLHVEGRDVPLAGELTDTILAAPTTEDDLAEVWRWLAPRGRADVQASLPLGTHPDPIRLTADLKDASIRLDAVNAADPLEVSQLTGRLEVEGNRVELLGLNGMLLGAPVAVSGRIVGGTDGAWDLTITTETLRVSRRLLDAIRHLTGDACFMPACLDLEDGARLELELTLRREPGADSPLQAWVRATNVDGVVRFPSGVRLSVRGRRLEVRGDDIVIDGVEIEGPGVLVDVHHAHVGEATQRGLFVAHLNEFAAAPDLLALLPEDVQKLFLKYFGGRVLSSDAFEILLRDDGSLRLDGDLAISLAEEAAETDVAEGARGRLEARPLELSAPDGGGRRTLKGRVLFDGFTADADLPLEDVYGQMDIETLRLGSQPASQSASQAEGRGVLRVTAGRLLDLRVKEMVMPYTWAGGILRADPVTGTLAEGRLSGSFVLHTGEPGAYEGRVRIDDFRLELLKEDLAPTGPPVSGRGTARFSFQSRSGEVRDLTGEGAVSIREGNLGDLPVVATVFAFLGQALGVQEPPRFERADAVFTLQDEVLHLSRFDLAGPLFEMPGEGSLDLGGFVDLTFTPDFIKSFVLPGIMQFPVVGNVLDVVLREDLFYAIRLRGDVSTAEPEVIALPPLRLQEARAFEGTGVPKLPPRRLPRWFR